LAADAVPRWRISLTYSLSEFRMPVAQVVAMFCLAIVVHVSTLAAIAHACGVKLRKVRFGVGPVIGRLGIFEVAMLPLSGHIKMKDTREERLLSQPLDDAFDHQPRWKQVAVPLGGGLSLLMVAMAVLGVEGWTAFVAGFAQSFTGGLQPLSMGPALLHGFMKFLQARGFLDAAALFFAKVSAFNLLPIPLLNGGAVVLTLLGMNRASEKTQIRLQYLGLCIVGVLWLGWTTSLLVFAWQSMG